MDISIKKSHRYFHLLKELGSLLSLPQASTDLILNGLTIWSKHLINLIFTYFKKILFWVAVCVSHHFYWIWQRGCLHLLCIPGDFQLSGEGSFRKCFSNGHELFRTLLKKLDRKKSSFKKEFERSSHVLVLFISIYFGAYEIIRGPF